MIDILSQLLATGCSRRFECFHDCDDSSICVITEKETKETDKSSVWPLKVVVMGEQSIQEYES